MTLVEQYEKETGKKAIYRVNSSDYHTLRYVKWLENKIEQSRAKLEAGNQKCDCCEIQFTPCPHHHNDNICALKQNRVKANCLKQNL